MKEFYDGKPRPVLHTDYSQEDLDRICLNCGQRFGRHSGYYCISKETVRDTEDKRKEFYDGKPRPALCTDYSQKDLDRICLNCGQRFGRHSGYYCIEEE